LKTKLSLILLLLISTTTVAYSQADSATRYDHFVGVQINRLLNQVFSFGFTPSVNNNPYLFTYSMNSHRTGRGFHVGLGINYQNNSINDDIRSESFNNLDYEIRAGYDKLYRFGRHWDAGLGFDLIYQNNADNTNTVIHDGLTQTSTVKTMSQLYGGGPMGYLRYRLSGKFYIGSEVSLYFMQGHPTQSSDLVSTQNGRVLSESHLKSSIFQSQLTINPPIAVYMVVRF
jgi:hypothetical protein